MHFLLMQDLDLKDKKVLIREDLNVPVHNGEIADDSRIKAALPTIALALEKGARVLCISHLGRPQEGEFDPQFSLEAVAKKLAELLGKPVRFVKDWIDGVELQPGEVAVGENVRFLVGESANDLMLAKRMAMLCDVFVMDAFATAHRAQASTYGVAEFAPVAAAGLLFAKEVEALSKAVEHPERPLAAVVGGAKVSSKLSLLKGLLQKVDLLIPGGGIANTFLKAQGIEVGRSLFEPDLVDEAKSILGAARAKGIDVLLPDDVVVTDDLKDGANGKVKAIANVGVNDIIADIGPESIRRYAERLAQVKTAVWNGPLGVFEYAPFAEGTKAIGQAIAQCAFSIAGGGETVEAIHRFNIEGIGYISTAGGAFLEFLEGKELPAIAILEKRARS
jgi:phosphoglycerate kinase